jgi:hypothetical protein
VKRAVQKFSEHTEIFEKGISSVELVRPQLVCPCQRYPPLDVGRIHCEKYSIVFISTPLNIKVSITIRYGYQVTYSVFVVLLFSCRQCDIPKSHLQVALTKGKGGSRHNYRSPTMWYVFIFLSIIILFVDCKKKPLRPSPGHSETTSQSFRFSL